MGHSSTLALTLRSKIATNEYARGAARSPLPELVQSQLTLFRLDRWSIHCIAKLGFHTSTLEKMPSRQSRLCACAMSYSGRAVAKAHFDCLFRLPHPTTRCAHKKRFPTISRHRSSIFRSREISRRYLHPEHSQVHDFRVQTFISRNCHLQSDNQRSCSHKPNNSRHRWSSHAA